MVVGVCMGVVEEVIAVETKEAEVEAVEGVMAVLDTNGNDMLPSMV